MDIQTFIVNFENAVDDIAPGSVSAGTAFTKLPQWDSLALLNLLAMIDGEYGVQVSGAKIQACANIGELFELVKSAKK